MNLVFSKKFTKKFSKYTPAIQKQVYQAIKRIPLGDVKFLTGTSTPKMYRLRVAKYRIIFYYSNTTNIHILKIDSRGDVYKN